MSDEFKAHRAEIYRRMRDEQPAYRDPDDRFWALSRYADVRGAAADPARFTAVTAEAKILKPIMTDMDPPQHTALRNVLSRAFTPRRVTSLEPRVREIARELVGPMATRGRCDLIAEFAALFPSRVIGELMGIPPEMLDDFRELTDKVMRLRTPEGNVGVADRIYELFATLLAERRRQPADDLMSALLAAEVDGRRLSEDELLGFCYLLLIGGNDTTTNLIGNGMELLVRHPEQRREVVADPELLPGAIEEMLRIESPSQGQARNTTVDVDVDGTVIPAGVRVLLLWGSANLDEREFAEPDRFDIHRDASRHVALGHGVHYCMGAALLRLEARVAFEELLAVMPEAELAEEPAWITSSWARGREAIELVYEPSVPLA